MALLGISPIDFWSLEIWEVNVALAEWEEEQKKQLMMWRQSNYIMAAPHFDPKKATPTVEQFHPFPWDQSYGKKKEIIPYDEQIEFAQRRGVTDWIPNHWYLHSEKYKHLAKQPD